MRELINRVIEMESYYDRLHEAVKEKKSIEIYHTEIQALKLYLESGQWLEDYESDERGELPLELKRGVLSEDGLYNLLVDVENVLST
ncbi:MAG: DUF4298 domain-containing protein [Agathobacter sp.]|nr:DUF4298 domain-containing protein [Agathobacter sp.]